MSGLGHFITSHRAFWVALLFSIALWLVSALSDDQTLEATIRIEWRGYDTARYVVAQADTTLRVQLTTPGFNAIGRTTHLRTNGYVINATSDTTLYAADCLKDIVAQLGLQGVHNVSTRQQTLTLRLTQRRSRSYVPRLKEVKLSFVEPFGIAGEPSVKPDTVWLYGSEQSLREIDEVVTVATTIADISTTATHTIALDPMWTRYPDVRPSTHSLQLTIPTAAYSEKTFTLPISIESTGGQKVRIYPEQASVTLWVADETHNTIANDMIRLGVDFAHRDSITDRMTIRATNFPNYVRIKDITPAEVRYVVIK